MNTKSKGFFTDAVRSTLPNSKERMLALAAVRWVLATNDGRFVAVDQNAQARLVAGLSDATVYDGRDNEQLKARFFEILLGEPLNAVTID